MAVCRRWYPSAFRAGSWYWLGAVSLTLLWLAALGLAPEAGLTRSYWYPVGAATEPIIEEHVTAVDLAFIDERNRPTRNYRVRWQGVWFSPRAERVDFHAGADDGVILRVDGDTVLERSPALGMHTVARTVELAAGAHRLEIDHWQDGGGRSLNVQSAPAGGTPALLGPTRLSANPSWAPGRPSDCSKEIPFRTSSNRFTGRTTLSFPPPDTWSMTGWRIWPNSVFQP